MVSKASEDLPDPERPVITVRVLRGISMLMFFRLCWRAPRTTSLVRPMFTRAPSTGAPALSRYTEARITSKDNRGASGGSRSGAYRVCLTRKIARGVPRFYQDAGKERVG